jgi:hypothetical protein
MDSIRITTGKHAADRFFGRCFLPSCGAKRLRLWVSNIDINRSNYDCGENRVFHWRSAICRAPEANRSIQKIENTSITADRRLVALAPGKIYEAMLHLVK